MKILVAEDNAVTATLMMGVLSRAGHSVVLAPNGSEALELLRSNPDIQGVITDIMMPESSGLDLLQALQEHHKRTPAHPSAPAKENPKGFIHYKINISNLQHFQETPIDDGDGVAYSPLRQY